MRVDRRHTKFSERQSGASVLEYVVIMGLITVIAISAVDFSGFQVRQLFTQVDTRLQDSAGGVSGGGSGSGSGGDTTPPQALSVVLAGSVVDDLVDGNELILKVTFSEPVQISGAPSIAVTLDALSGQVATYLSRLDDDELFFTYTIPSDQATYSNFAVSSLNAGVEDGAGNAASSTLPAFSLTGTFTCVPPVGVVYVFDTNGIVNWDRPCGVTTATVELWGGGAGGGSGGGGGGGGKCATGGTVGTGGSRNGGSTAEAGDSSIRSSGAIILRTIGGDGSDHGRGGHEGSGAHTTPGSPGGAGREGFDTPVVANTFDGGVGMTIIANVTQNQGAAGITGIAGIGSTSGTGGQGGAGGAAIISQRDGTTSAGKGGNGGAGGDGGDGAGPNPSFGTFGGGGGGGGGGAGGNGGGYLYASSVPIGASGLEITIGDGTAGQPDNAGGVGGVSLCGGAEDGEIGSGSEDGQDGLVIVIPE